MPYKHQRVRLRVGLEGRVSWREQSIVEKLLPIGKKRTISMPAELISEIQLANRPVTVFVEAVQLYDVPDPDMLYTVRKALVCLAPPALKDLFEEVRTIKTWQEWTDFEGRLVDAVIERATVVSTEWSGDRSPCPLCGGVPQSSAIGFAFPTGLTWHLTGNGNAQQCNVTCALQDWFRDR